MRTHRQRTRLLILITLAAAIPLLFLDPIPQDPRYHAFADGRTIAGISNFWNVVTNLLFLMVGGIGLLRFPRFTHPENRDAYLAFCLGVMLVGFGSAYYHLAPSNSRLFWDRLPMTVAFMAMLSLLLGERVLRKGRRACLWLLVAVGISAALYWFWTESLGRGDLRPYALVQFLPILLIPLILFLFPRQDLHNSKLFWAAGLYLVAKLFEQFDGLLFAATGLMGGHTLKHVAAAAAALCLIYAVPARRSKR